MNGYIYTLKMGASPPPSGVDFQVFDAGLYKRTNQGIETGDWIDSGNWTTHYDIFDKDTTPLDITDNLHMTSAQCNRGTSITGNVADSGSWALSSNDASATFKNNWVTLCHLPAVANATYIIKVRTDHSVDGTTGSGSNRYALVARPTNAAQTGSTMSLSAYANMAIYNNVDTGQGTFYLAEVQDQYKGKTLDINLWDPGDVGGSTTAQLTVNTPVGPLPCTWQSTYGTNYTSPPTGNGAGGAPKTPTSGSSTPGCTIVTATSGSSKFNGEWLRIRVPIPISYTCTPSTPGDLRTLPGCWWSITYKFSSTGNTDNTTWAVNVEGDPIHLIQ